LQQQIVLNTAQPIVSGAYRDVYQHPHHDDLLIKVIKQIVIEKYEQQASWHGNGNRDRHYKNLVREIQEYLVLRGRGQHELPFIQHFVGVVDTDLGFGMMVRKVRGRDGKLAPTLTALVQRTGLSAELRRRIDDLHADVVRHHVIFGDISGRNIVHAEDREHGDRLVIIDGLSDRLWIPVNSMSRTIHRIYCRRRFARAIETLEAIDRKRMA
jgi:hypothetical protein